MARARLRDRHQAMLRKKLFQLKVEVVLYVKGTWSFKWWYYSLQEASSSAATDNALFPIATSGDAAQRSGEDTTADSERPGTSGATTTAAEGLVLPVV